MKTFKLEKNYDTIRFMIFVEAQNGLTMAEQFFEIVERKGKGHPDTICDSVVEAISVALSAEYKKFFGTILHHNIDKALLVAGKVEKYFGGGTVKQPMELIIGDRATFAVEDKKIPVKELAITAAENWFKNNLRFFDPKKHLKINVALAPGSVELTSIFKHKQKVLMANDTSAAVGFYPLTPVERIVLDVEKHLNSNDYKALYPETGEDVKVMAIRRGDEMTLTVAMPLIAHFIYSEKEYFQKKEKIYNDLKKFLKKYSKLYQIKLNINALDKKNDGINGTYISLLGTSAEDADSGQVGRGNKVNGIIPVARPIGTEAAAGKNPVSHVGKIYNVFAHYLAKKIHQKVDGIREIYVYLVSTIGNPINHPETVTAKIITEKHIRLIDVSGKISEIIEKELSDMPHFCDNLSKGKFPVC